jgi:hypothetical protein
MSETVRMVCSRCGSEEVVADAYAEWNVDSQAWGIVQTFDKGRILLQMRRGNSN